VGAIRRTFSDLLRRARIERYQRRKLRDDRAEHQCQDRDERREQGMPEGPVGNRWGPGGGTPF
jgi:hypothetical protein